MKDINTVNLVGRLTRDSELRYTSGGMAINNMSIAVNWSRKKGDTYVDEVSFFDVVLWGRQGEALSKYLLKGKQIAVMGELRQERWEKDGVKRSKVVINAMTIQLLGGNSQESEPPRRSAPAPAITSAFEDEIPF